MTLADHWERTRDILPALWMQIMLAAEADGEKIFEDPPPVSERLLDALARFPSIDRRLAVLGLAEQRASNLFHDLAIFHGKAEASRIFKEAASGPAKRTIRKLNNEGILDRLDNMPKRSFNGLARELVKEGLGTFPTVLHRIKTLRTKREAAIKKGTWDGPPLWNRKQNSYAYRKGIIKI
jgi:hypothetical protein